MKLKFLLLITPILIAGCTTTPTSTQPPPTNAPAAQPTEPSKATDTALPLPTKQPSPLPPTAIPYATDSSPTEPPTAAPAASPTPAIAYMTYQDFSIVPNTLTITAGTKVIFLIKGGFGSFHQPYSSFPNSTDLSGLFEAPPLLGDGASYAYTFTQPGTYTVRCGYHPNDMVATITITP